MWFLESNGSTEGLFRAFLGSPRWQDRSHSSESEVEESEDETEEEDEDPESEEELCKLI